MILVASHLLTSCAVQECNAAFQPGTSKLTRLFLYTLPPQNRARPDNITEAQWQHALQKAGGPANPDGRWPVAVRGMRELKAHRDAQVRRTMP